MNNYILVVYKSDLNPLFDCKLSMGVLYQSRWRPQVREWLSFTDKYIEAEVIKIVHECYSTSVHVRILNPLSDTQHLIQFLSDTHRALSYLDKETQDWLL